MVDKIIKRNKMNLLDKLPIFFKMYGYIRMRVAKQFRELVLQDDEYKEYEKALDKYFSEMQYSSHCGSTRDGSESDRQYNISVNKKVDIYSEKKDKYLKKFATKYLIKDQIPLVEVTNAFRNYYLDTMVSYSFLAQWIPNDTGGSIMNYYIKIK